MKIVQYLRSFSSADGGVVRAVIDLATALASRDHAIVVLTTDQSDLPPGWDGRDRRPLPQVLSAHRVLPRWLSRHSLRLGRQALHEAKAALAGADVLHLHVPWDPICVQLARLARETNLPYVVSVHGMLDDWTMRHKAGKKRLFLAMGARRMLEQAAAVQFTSRVEAEQSQQWFSCKRSVVAPLIFDTSAFDHLPGLDVARRKFFPTLAPAPDVPLILYLGRLHPIKRIDLLLEAVCRLRDANEPFHLVIAGAGEPHHEQELRKAVDSHSLQPWASFVGFAQGQEKLSLYQAAVVAVNPSAYESFGLVSIEALACGTPIIITKAVNIWPELQSSGGASIVAPNAQSLCDAIRSIINNAGDAGRRGLRARQWVLDSFGPDRVVHLYEQMYRGAIEGRTVSHHHSPR
ncbi:MAG: glycosyltransferase [Phycisphaerales bacterium]|nr:glycosyltransferase [Phycisphaerales bacterium]MCI0674222.1 glycosyltransferase [Phycisphaerales bacterium]